MACSCDSCSSPRIIKTRTALFWRWYAQSRGETGDRVIPAPVLALPVSVGSGPTDHGMPIETAEAWRDVWPDEADQQALAELLGWGQPAECGGTSLA
jgi:hypothetical protein